MNDSTFGFCDYKTPCGWCTKWDKKCDNQIANNKSSLQKENKQDKTKCEYFSKGCCMGTKEQDACDLNFRGISYCDRYKEN